MKKTICITGASRGIGHALAAEFLHKGHRVFGTARKPDNLETLKEQFPELFFPLRVDVTDEDSLDKARDAVQSQSASLDILVNNAGILTERQVPPLPQVSIDAMIESFAVNTLGPLRSAQALYPLLRKSDDPLIVNVSSVMGSIEGVSDERPYAYSTTKAALNMLTRILYRNLKSEHFRVFCVHPGWVRTDMGGAEASFSVEESARGLYTQILAWKHGDPEFLDFQGNKLAW